MNLCVFVLYTRLNISTELNKILQWSYILFRGRRGFKPPFSWSFCCPINSAIVNCTCNSKMASRPSRTLWISGRKNRTLQNLSTTCLSVEDCSGLKI